MTKTRSHNLLIRPYCDEDFSEVALLEADRAHEPYRSSVFVRQMAALCPATFLVAKTDDIVVGFTVGTIVQDDPTRGWILRMMVLDGFRHQGIGTALLRAVTGALNVRSVQTIFLTVAPGNIPAIQLYQHEGFVQESFQPAYFGGGEDRLVMKKIHEPCTISGC